MSEDTTTSDVDTSAVDETITGVEDEQNTGAVTNDEDTSQTSEGSENESQEDNSEEAELKEWAASKNLPLDDPLKLAKMYREAEKSLGTKGQREGQLKNAVSSANQASNTEDYQALKNEVEALSFWVNHPGAKETYESTMVGILEEKPYLASDLDAVLDIARGRATTDAATRLAERQAGKKEALADAEKAGRAAQPRVSARSTTPSNSKITPDTVEQVIAQHMGDPVWYKAHLPEINAALGA